MSITIPTNRAAYDATTTLILDQIGVVVAGLDRHRDCTDPSTPSIQRVHELMRVSALLEQARAILDLEVQP